MLLRSVCRCVLQHKPVLGPQQLQESNRIRIAPRHPRSPTPGGTALSWKGEPPSGCGWGVGASDGSRPTEPSHTWPGRRGAHAMQPAAAMLPSIPQSPRFTGLKHRAGKELAAFVLPRVSMTAVPLTLSSFSRGERSSAILAWTWSENCL